MKTFVHKKTGEEITYTDGCIYFGKGVIEAEPNLEFWQEVVKREPLFKTFDGVDVFEGDYYHSVNPLYIYCGKNTITISNRPDKSNHWETNRNCLKFFSSKEKAKEFIILNKPCLSLKEVTEYWQQEKDLKELVKSRL